MFLKIYNVKINQTRIKLKTYLVLVDIALELAPKLEHFVQQFLVHLRQLQEQLPQLEQLEFQVEWVVLEHFPLVLQVEELRLELA